MEVGFLFPLFGLTLRFLCEFSTTGIGFIKTLEFFLGAVKPDGLNMTEPLVPVGINLDALTTTGS
jgi:hypothetical protein